VRPTNQHFVQNLPVPLASYSIAILSYAALLAGILWLLKNVPVERPGYRCAFAQVGDEFVYPGKLFVGYNLLLAGLNALSPAIVS